MFVTGLMIDKKASAYTETVKRASKAKNAEIRFYRFERSFTFSEGFQRDFRHKVDSI